MRRSIIAHPARVDESNVAELKDMAFAFVAIDAGPARS